MTTPTSIYINTSRNNKSRVVGGEEDGFIWYFNYETETNFKGGGELRWKRTSSLGSVGEIVRYNMYTIRNVTYPLAYHSLTPVTSRHETYEPIFEYYS